MEIKKGTSAIPIFVKIRIGGSVVTLSAHQAQYGTPSVIQYTLEWKSVDKSVTGSVNYDSGNSTSDALYFLLPATLFAKENMVYIAALKWQMDSIEDFGQENFEIKVTDANAPNVR